MLEEMGEGKYYRLLWHRGKREKMAAARRDTGSNNVDFVFYFLAGPGLICQFSYFLPKLI